MKRFPTIIHFCIFFVIVMTVGCGPSLKNTPDISAKGFLTDHCYRAIIVVQADPEARGLVAMRENSSEKAGDRSLLYRLALENLAQYAMETGIQDGSINRRAPDFDAAHYRERLIEVLGRTMARGRIVYTYYDENHSVVVGYEFRGAGLKNKVAAITSTPGD
jgi:hypothetical protein